MKKLIITLVVIAAIAGSVGAYYMTRSGPAPQVATAQVSRGDIVDTVGATGTLDAVTSVQVGTQVSGTLMELGADFNSIVHKGQIIARLDPSLFQTQIEQAKANLLRSQADVDRLRVALDDAKTKLRRTEELAKRNLVPASDLETAQVNVRAADAQLKSSEAATTQAQASLNQNVVNLEHTVISAPIDGIVVARNIDIGQTVAASFQSPTLFVIAADLTKMKVSANVDEADVGRIRPGQRVRFRVDAYPAQEFIGTVAQVRLQPIVVQNVVTYATVIDVPNPDLRLKPGMTANVNIEIARKSDVVRVPNAALRFRPTPEIFTALNLPVPPEVQRGNGRSRDGRMAGGMPGAGAAGEAPATAGGAPTAATGADPARPGSAGQQRAAGDRPAGQGGIQRGGGDRAAADPPRADASRGTAAAAGADPPATPGQPGVQRPDQGGGERWQRAEGGTPGQMDPERRQRMMERLQQMPPEERAAFIKRLQDRGIPVPEMTGGSAGSKTAGGAAGRAGGSPVARPQAGALAARGAQTIDSLFGPLPATVSFARAWLYVNKELKPVRLRLGISDGTYTELLDGSLQPGMDLVTSVITGDQPRTGFGAQSPGRSPLMGGRGPGGPH